MKSRVPQKVRQLSLGKAELRCIFVGQVSAHLPVAYEHIIISILACSRLSDSSSLRAGSRLGFMREMRDASGEAARAWGEVGWAAHPPRLTLSRLRRSSRGFATRVSHLAHKT